MFIVTFKLLLIARKIKRLKIVGCMETFQMQSFYAFSVGMPQNVYVVTFIRSRLKVEMHSLGFLFLEYYKFN